MGECQSYNFELKTKLRDLSSVYAMYKAVPMCGLFMVSAFFTASDILFCTSFLLDFLDYPDFFKDI